MKTKAILLLFLLCASARFGAYAQTTIGRQKVDQYPTTAWGTLTYGLTWLPTDYGSTTTKYPLIIFLHGSGEGGTSVGSLYNLISTALPLKISQGWNPEAVNPVTGAATKFIVVSPQAPGWSYSYSHVQWILADVAARYRVDTTRIYITGLSAGGAGTWSCVTNGAAFAQKIAAIVPVSGAGTNTTSESDQLPLVGGTYGIKAWSICGTGDSFWSLANTYTTIVNSANPQPMVPAVASGVPGGHSAEAWNTAYDPSWKSNALNLNMYEWMLKYTRGTAPVVVAPPVAVAGVAQSITLPLSQVLLSGSGSAAPGNSIASYAWSKLSGPASFTIATPASATTAVTGLAQGSYTFRLRVTDNLGASATSDVLVTVAAAPAPPPPPPANILPVAGAGADQTITLPLNSVTLSGSGTDADGTIAAYAWSKVSGPASGTIASAATAQTGVTGLAQGTYRFGLRVTDNAGGQAWDTVQVTVNAAPPPPPPANIPPVAGAGADQTINLPLNNVTLSGSGTDADGTVVSYAWSKVSGPASGTIASAATAQTGVTGLAQGTYRFGLRVTDNAGGQAWDTVQVTVNAAPPPPPPANILPVAGAGADQTITLPLNNVTLSGSGTDADGTVVSYAWSKVSGPASGTIASAATAQTGVTGLAQGTYRFGLRVTDNAGGQAWDTVQVTVNAAPPPPPPANIPPVAGAGADQTITLPLNSVTLSGSGTDADGTVVSFSWSKVSGPASGNIASPSGPSTPVTGLSQGAYKFALEVRDNSGATARDTVGVTVNAAAPPPANVLPTANAGADQSITLPQNATTLSGSGIDTDGTIASYNWTKVSGPATFTITAPAAMQTTVTGMAQGTFLFELRVTDNSGGTARDTVRITVNPAANIPPTVNAGGDQTLTGSSALLTGNGADADGSVVSYSWTKLSGPSAGTISTPNAATTALTALVQGVYIFRLTATDNNGASGSDDVSITISACGGVRRTILPWSDGGRYLSGKPGNFGYMAHNPGDTLVLKASFNTWSYFTMEDFHGTPSCPIVIINEGGQVKMTRGLDLKHCSDIKVTGSGSADTYGFYVHNPADNDNQGVAIGVQGRSRNIEIEKIFVHKKTYGAWIKQDPQCADSLNYPNWHMDNIKLHDSKFLNIGQDCIYAGNTDAIGTRDVVCNGQVRRPIPMRLSNIHIYNLIIDSCMRTGIQLSGCDSGYNTIHNNVITRCGYELNQQQGTGISIGGMTKNCYVTGNMVKSTFLYGILSLGAGTNYIENNTVDSSGYLDGVSNTVSRPSNIYVDTRITIPFDSSKVIIRNNRLGVNSSLHNQDIYFNRTVPTYASGNLICGNTELDGSTPSRFYVQPGIHYSNCLPVPPGNRVPIANAGSDQTVLLPNNYVVLNGSHMDADGTVVGTNWSKLEGPASFNILAFNQPQTGVANLTAGVYKFVFSVTDNGGAIDRDTVMITVISSTVPPPPVAVAGVAQSITLPLSQVLLSGSGSAAPGNSIASYAWSKLSGPASFTIATPASATTAVTGLAQGSYTFRLRVTDNLGASATSDVLVTVAAAPAPPPPPPANILPVAGAGADQTITLPLNNVTLSGSGTDADGTVVSYAWSKVSGPAGGTIASAATAQTGVTGLAQGTYRFGLRVTDNAGGQAWDTVQVTVNAAPPPPPPANIPPVAGAGADQTITLPKNNVHLAGSGTDADGTVVSFTWSKVSGPASGNIASPSGPSTPVTGLSQGAYKFALEVRDNSGATARDTVDVTVNAAAAPPANVLPTANAGADQSITLPQNATTLSGSGIDTDGTIASYNWLQVSGPATAGIVGTNNPQVSVSGLTQGLYLFQFQVTDNRGGSHRDTVAVQVNAAAAPPSPANMAPIANAGNDITITLPVNMVSLSGTGIDADGSIVAHVWTKIGGPQHFVITAPGSAQTTVTGLVEGDYLFELMVSDNSNATARDTIVVSVRGHVAPPPPANIAPEANAGADASITLPLNWVHLNGTGTDADGTIVAYSWSSLSGAANAQFSNPAAAQTSVTGLTEGTYHFRFGVTDNAGTTTWDTVNITVHAAPPPPPPANLAPKANAGADVTITLPLNSMLLAGSGTDADGTIVSYAWTKVAGPAGGALFTPSNAQSPVTGLLQGDYYFELQVRDNNGAVARDTVRITVQPVPNVAPRANAGWDLQITAPNNTVQLSGTGADTDGTIAAYQWMKVSGPAQASMTASQFPSVTVGNMVPGNYEFELTVTDNAGAIGRDTMSVIVNKALNVPPVADAGTDRVVYLPVDSFQLKGVGSDADGLIASYKWKKMSGPADAKLGDSKDPNVVITGMEEGEYTFELTVTDDAGASASDLVTIIVRPMPHSKVSVFPNPSSGKAIVKINANTVQNVTTLVVYDSGARPVIREVFMRSQKDITHEIDLSAFPNGIYLVEIAADINHKITTKVVKY